VGSGEWGFDQSFGHSERFEKSSIHIFPSCIFLLAKPVQKNAGLEDVNVQFLKAGK